MKKIISFVGLFAVLGVGIGDAHGVAMSAQVRRLLQEKQEKIEQLEKCEGKKQGWMIAGISTIGLTAVGVGVNIAQASKSNRLSDEIEMEKSTLERHQNELNRIQNDIAAERARQAQQNGGGNGQSGGGGGSSVSAPVPEGSNIIGKQCGNENAGTWISCNDAFCGKECYDNKKDEQVSCACVQTDCLKNGKLRNYYTILDDTGEPVPFANIKCEGIDALAIDPEDIGALASHATNFDGHFCLEENIKNDAKCSIACIGLNPMAGTMGELKDALKKNNNKLIMCSVPIDLEKTYKFGESCENSSNNPNTSQSGGAGSVSSTSTGNSSSSGGGQIVNPVKPETSLQKCLRERSDDRVGTACCYLSKSVATYEKGACVCVGKGKTFEIDKDGHGLCIDVQPDVVGPERVLNMPCVEDDLQHPAKTGVYVNNGELLCKDLPSVDVATYPCSCKITSCSDGFHVSNKNNGCEDNCPGNNQKWDKATQKCYDVSCVLGANRIGDSACKCMDGLRREELADGRVKCIDEFGERPGRNVPFRPFQ